MLWMWIVRLVDSLQSSVVKVRMMDQRNVGLGSDKNRSKQFPSLRLKTSVLAKALGFSRTCGLPDLHGGLDVRRTAASLIRPSWKEIPLMPIS